MRAKFYYLQSYALQMLSKAIRYGDLTPANQCEKCGIVPKNRTLHGHHEDYSRPLEVIWLCDSCHRIEHNRDGEYSKPRAAKKVMRIIQWFQEHPEHLDTPTRSIGKQLGVSHVTVWKARLFIKAEMDTFNNGHAGAGEEANDGSETR